MPDDAWAETAQRFADHYETLVGQVRAHVIDAQLRRHLPPAPAAIVDIGGGAGHQSIPLARDGYLVTLVDPSPEMLQRARQGLADEDPATGSRVELVESDGEHAPEILGRRRFEAVLCHGVLLYVEDPAPLISAITDLAATDGFVSIMAKNQRSLALRPALNRDWHGALAAFDATHELNELGLMTRADTPEAVAAELGHHGFTTADLYGVRLFTEAWGRDRAPVDPESPVLAAELEASLRDPYRQLSRLFHLVARRPR